MKTAHTPTPWFKFDDHKYSAFIATSDDPADFDKSVVACELSHADAAFIVKAVNCHDDLVAALEGALNDMIIRAGVDPDAPHSAWFKKTYGYMYEAIAKAKGE